MSMSTHFVEDENKNVRRASLAEWGAYFNSANRHVGDFSIDDVRVSTVFLGIDHGYGGGPPLIYESMIFGGEFDQETHRYATRDEAKAGHVRLVEKVTAAKST